jgi:muramoyltetrapeptide carboxypeptidase
LTVKHCLSSYPSRQMQSRRTLIKNAGILASLSLVPSAHANLVDQPNAPKARIRPPRLKENDVIGLVTPAGPIVKRQLEETIGKLASLGLRAYHTESVLSQYGYFAGSDQERADDLMHMFTSQNVDGILCVRGGYGAIRILDLLDFGQIKQNPKVFIGYSDITALLCSIYEQAGLVTFHGPLGISPFNGFSVDSFKRVLMNAEPQHTYPYEREENTGDNPEFDAYTINGGKAEGELIGGNISVLDSMIGSKYEPNFENRIVYLEEIDEKTYRVDKMLVHLLQATDLKKAAGIVMGVFNNCSVNDEPRLTLKEAITDLLKPLDIPISYGMSFGHIDKTVTIPTGVRSRMNADRNRLRLLERAVS